MSRNKKKPRNKTPTPPRIENTGYSSGAASTQKETLKAWRPVRASAKSDIDSNLWPLRNRSADIATNNPIGDAAIKTSRTHVIGDGLKLFPRIDYEILGMTPDEARHWGRETTREFALWANNIKCDIMQKNNFMDLQDIAYRAYLIDGDCFCIFRRKPPTSDMPYTLRLQLVEANRVSNPNIYANQGEAYASSPQTVVARNEKNGNKIISGVEIDNDGAIVAYWISNKLSYDLTDYQDKMEWVRVATFGTQSKCRNILQISHDDRSEQYRGVPYLASVIETLKQTDRYAQAELASAIVRSFLTIFFTSSMNNGGNSLGDILKSPYSDETGEAEPVVDPGEYQLGTAVINSLPPGVDVKTIDSKNNQSMFEQFQTQLIKSVAAALEQPYEVLMKSFTSSYSASRAALLQAWAQYKIRRAWFVRDFAQPVYEMWLAEAVAIGRIKAPGFFDDIKKRAAYSRAEWYGPAEEILDPIKDLQGAQLRIKMGLSTHEREAAEMTNSDYYRNLDAIQQEQGEADKKGVTLGDGKEPTEETNTKPTPNTATQE